MTPNPHVVALLSLLTVGRRNATVLAAEATIEPKAAVDEILAQGSASVAAARRDALADSGAHVEEATEHRATLERLTDEQEILEVSRNEDRETAESGRFWLAPVAATITVGSTLTLSIGLMADGVTGERDLQIALALGAVTAIAAGDWAGRTSRTRVAAWALAPVFLAIVAATTVGVVVEVSAAFYPIEVTLMSTAATAGLLTGRGRRIRRTLRVVDTLQRTRMETANTRQRTRESAAALAVDAEEYAATVDELAATVLRAVEEYLRKVDDRKIRKGLFGTGGAEELRERARDHTRAWPRTLVVLSG